MKKSALDLHTLLAQQNKGRDPERLAMKYAKMRDSAFSFFRGSSPLYWLRVKQAAGSIKAPSAWICGDLHLENYGTYKGDNRLVYFDINDFDEACLAPATLDILRLGSSVLVAQEGTGLASKQVTALVTQMVDAYGNALTSGKAFQIERPTAPHMIRQLMEKLQTQQRVDFLNRRTELGRKRRRLKVDGVKALPADESQHELVRHLLSGVAAKSINPAFFEVLDVARRIAGTGSLGLERYVVLVKGKGSPDQNYLLDLKLCTRSAAEPCASGQQPEWKSQAHRVAEIQRRMQPVSVGLLQPIKHGKKSFLLRTLSPLEDRINWQKAPSFEHAHAREVLLTMARLSAWSQLRSSGREGSAIADELIEFGAAQRWRQELVDLAHQMAKQAAMDALHFQQDHIESHGV